MASVPPSRDALILSRFLSGSTTAELGRAFKLSRERVRQILGAQGVGHVFQTRRDMAEARRAARRQEVSRNYLRRYGCTREEYRAIRAADNAAVYGRFRDNAGAECQLSFPQWWSVWSASGHWPERGRGGYWLARIDPRRPFRVGNVVVRSAGRRRRGAR